MRAVDKRFVWTRADNGDWTANGWRLVRVYQRGPRGSSHWRVHYAEAYRETCGTLGDAKHYAEAAVVPKSWPDCYRLYRVDGTLADDTHVPVDDDNVNKPSGETFALKIELFAKKLVAECDAAGADLRDLENIWHGMIGLPVATALVKKQSKL